MKMSAIDVFSNEYSKNCFALNNDGEYISFSILLVMDKRQNRHNAVDCLKLIKCNEINSNERE